MPGLGRKYSEDPNDARYLIRALPRAEPTDRTYRYWNKGPWQGDQGDSSACVGFSLTHWLQCGPVTNRARGPHMSWPYGPVESPYVVYYQAQRIDEFAGQEPEMQGTSVRAGAKILQSMGYIESYYWAQTLDEVVTTLLTRGPVVLGTRWYRGMFDIDQHGFVSLTGRPAGGHAYLAYGASTREQFITCRNSWGPEWGVQGSFRLSFDDLASLLAEQGEAMLAMEKRPNPAGRARRPRRT